MPRTRNPVFVLILPEYQSENKIVITKWYDFGTATGERPIDLVCKIYNVDVPDALLILSGASIEKQFFSFSDRQSISQETKAEKEPRKLNESLTVFEIEMA